MTYILPKIQCNQSIKNINDYRIYLLAGLFIAKSKIYAEANKKFINPQIQSLRLKSLFFYFISTEIVSPF